MFRYIYIYIHNPILLLDSILHYSILTIPCSACVWISVFTQLYLRKWGQLLYQRITQSFFRNTRTFQGGGRYSHIGMVGWFRCDDPRFCDCQSDLVTIAWCNQIRLAPSFCRKNQFVSITYSSRNTWT